MTARSARKDLAFPLRRSLARQHADSDEHLRDMMAQVLFTLPGERLNLPDVQARVGTLSGGEMLRAGQIVLTGSLVRTRFPAAGQHYRFSLAGIGSVEARFEA